VVAVVGNMCDHRALRLPAAPVSVTVGRHWVGRRCEAWDLGPSASEGVLLASSELLTNAVVHARTPVELSATMAYGLMRVEVHDDDQAELRADQAGELAEGGRGLFLVDALSDRWGVSTTPSGKTVWFEWAFPADHPLASSCTCGPKRYPRPV